MVVFAYVRLQMECKKVMRHEVNSLRKEVPVVCWVCIQCPIIYDILDIALSWHKVKLLTVDRRAYSSILTVNSIATTSSKIKLKQYKQSL